MAVEVWNIWPLAVELDLNFGTECTIIYCKVRRACVWILDKVTCYIYIFEFCDSSIHVYLFFSHAAQNGNTWVTSCVHFAKYEDYSFWTDVSKGGWRTLLYERRTKKRGINKTSTYIAFSFCEDQKRGPLNPIGGKPAGGAINGRPPIGAKNRHFVLEKKQKLNN